MPADFLSSLSLILSWGATYLVHSTLLLGGVWVILTFKRAAGHSFSEALWKMALVGGVVTTSTQMLLAPPGLFGKFTFAVDLIRPEIARSANTDVPNVMFTADDRKTRAADRAAQNEFEINAFPADAVPEIANLADTGAVEAMSTRDEMVAAESRPTRVKDSIPHQSVWWIVAGDENRLIPTAAILAILVPLAAAALILGIVRFLWQTLALRQKLKGCAVINAGPARELLDELCLDVPGKPDVRLLSVTEDPEPAAFGIWQWTIVLPMRAARDLPPDELRALLAHELAHLVRGDSIWLFVSRIICSCLAFQPLNHLARREWQRAAEYLCDGWAVSRTGTPLALARCLTEVAGWRLSGQPSAALLAATGRKPGLSDRIERLLTAEQTDTWREVPHYRHIVVAAVIVLGLLAWCAPRVQMAVAAGNAASIEVLNDNTRMTDVVKPLVLEDGKLAVDDAAETEPGVTSVAIVDSAAGVASNVMPDATTLLELLDRELIALDAELRELQPLLLKDDASPPLMRLARRIRVEIVRLTERRDALRTKWKKLVP